jgi:pimeloyl-ACP methyl ester carboxylesterase
MRNAGFAVFAYDYRGYGLSTGRPSERRAYLDAEAAYDHLVHALGVPPEHIVLHGRSLGGAVAADLAARRPCAGLVLESTFVSAYRVLRPYAFLPFDRFRTLSKMPRVHCPVLVIHGTDDALVGAWHGRRLYDAAPGQRQAFWNRVVPAADVEPRSYRSAGTGRPRPAAYWFQVRSAVSVRGAALGLLDHTEELQPAELDERVHLERRDLVAEARG